METKLISSIVEDVNWMFARKNIFAYFYMYLEIYTCIGIYYV